MGSRFSEEEMAHDERMAHKLTGDLSTGGQMDRRLDDIPPIHWSLP